MHVFFPNMRSKIFSRLDQSLVVCIPLTQVRQFSDKKKIKVSVESSEDFKKFKIGCNRKLTVLNVEKLNQKKSNMDV